MRRRVVPGSDLVSWVSGPEEPLPFDEVGRESRVEDNSRGLLAALCDAANVYFFSVEALPEQTSVGEGEHSCT